MDAHEAREHLEMVDRILAHAEDEPVRIIPGLVIAWGIGAAAIDAGQQLYFSHVAGHAGLWLGYTAMAAAMLYTIVVMASLFRGNRYERVSKIEMRMGRAIGAVWFTVFVAAFAQPVVFAGWGGAAVWSMGAAITLFIPGFEGDRRGLFGGLVLMGSVLAANYLFPATPGYALAAGFLIGYLLPGLLFVFEAPRGEA